MKKTMELLQKINAKREEVMNMKNAGDIAGALKAAKELDELRAEYDVEKALEASTPTAGNPVGTQMAVKKDINMLRRAFNKKILAGTDVNVGSMTDEEMELAKTFKMEATGQAGATGAKGGYLIPQEFVTPIAEARAEYIALKDLCTLKLVSRMTGVMPKAAAENGKLLAFDENNAINQSTIDFGQVSFNIKTRGDIIPVSNELLADADVDLVGFVNQRFAKKAINSENDDIVKIMDTLVASAITDYKGIIKALNTELDPAIAADAVIITNQDGFNYLDTATDNDGKPILTYSFADFKATLLRGHKIVYLSNSAIPTKTNKIPFYVGSLADFAYFFEREGVALAADSSAGFTTNTTYLRVLERYDVQKVNEKAMAKLELTQGA